MCTSPLLIKNRRFRSVGVNIPTSYIKVPCGQCDECLQKRSRDLFLRARFESQRCILNGGCGFMCCLTYGPQLAPKLNYSGRTYFVFNKRHIINFIKRLRSNLDRYFMKYYGVIAPDFKYLVTSEYGSSSGHLHLPHYHLIFLFDKYIGFSTFRKAFCESLVNRRDKKRVFGKIFQCEPLDLKRGGVRYSCKYILKDVSYRYQNTILHELIKFNQEAINQEFNIIVNPYKDDDYLYNKSVRSRKDYRKAVNERIGIYRDMLQFYLCSNDFGLSAIIDHYGKSLFSLGCLCVDGFVYSIPKPVLQRLERTQGTAKKDSLTQSIFIDSFKQACEKLVLDSKLAPARSMELQDFVKNFLVFRSGTLYFNFEPLEVSYYDYKSFGSVSTDKLLEIYRFVFDNDFYETRQAVFQVLEQFNSPEYLSFRASVASHKAQLDKFNQQIKKRNKVL